MPDINERRSANGETRQWDGTAWRQVSADPPPQDNSATGALSRFMGGALSTSPLNPMNWARAIAHPIDTATNMVAAPLKNARAAIGDASDVVTGGENNDRLLALANLLQHAGGSVPLIGEPLRAAGEHIGNGDWAGGAGEIAGVGSGAYLPKVASKVPELPGMVGRGAGSLGRGMEAAGTAAQNARVPMLGAAEAIYRGDPKGLAVAATPYALEYGGKATQKLGSALEGLQGKVNLARGGQASVADAPFGPRAGSSEVRGSSFPSRPPMSPEDVGRADVASLRTGASLPNGAAANIANMEDVPSTTNGPGAYIDHAGQRMSEEPFTFEAADPNIPPSGGFEMKSNPLTDKPHPFTFEAGDPNVPPSAGLEMKSNPLVDKVSAATKGLDTEPAAAGPRIINRHDDMWGPGRAPALDPQVTTGFKGANNLKVDPSWDNDYLRQQLRDATDPAERDFLLKAYRQRLRVGDAMQGLQPQE